MAHPDVLRGWYWIASAAWTALMSSLAARSAIVLETRSARWYALADSPSCPHQRGRSGVEVAQLAEVAQPHLGVARYAAGAEALPLALASAYDPRPDRLRVFAQLVAAELFEVHPRHPEVQVDAVQHRPAQPLLIARHHRLGTHARLHLVL